MYRRETITPQPVRGAGRGDTAGPSRVQEDRCGTGILKAVTSEMIADPKREQVGIVVRFYCLVWRTGDVE